MTFQFLPFSSQQKKRTAFLLLVGLAFFVFQHFLASSFGADPASQLLRAILSGIGGGMIGGAILGWSNHRDLIKNPILLNEDKLIFQKQILLEDIQKAKKSTGYLELTYLQAKKVNRASINLLALENPDEFLVELEKRGVKIQNKSYATH